MQTKRELGLQTRKPMNKDTIPRLPSWFNLIIWHLDAMSQWIRRSKCKAQNRKRNQSTFTCHKCGVSIHLFISYFNLFMFHGFQWKKSTELNSLELQYLRNYVIFIFPKLIAWEIHRNKIYFILFYFFSFWILHTCWNYW